MDTSHRHRRRYIDALSLQSGGGIGDQFGLEGRVTPCLGDNFAEFWLIVRRKNFFHQKLFKYSDLFRPGKEACQLRNCDGLSKIVRKNLLHFHCLHKVNFVK